MKFFSFDGDNVTLNVGAITGDTYGGLTDMGIIEFAYKLMKVFYDTQVDFNLTRTTNRLNSFSSPFYGSVQNTTPPLKSPLVLLLSGKCPSLWTLLMVLMSNES